MTIGILETNRKWFRTAIIAGYNGARDTLEAPMRNHRIKLSLNDEELELFTKLAKGRGATLAETIRQVAVDSATIKREDQSIKWSKLLTEYPDLYKMYIDLIKTMQRVEELERGSGR